MIYYLDVTEPIIVIYSFAMLRSLAIIAKRNFLWGTHASSILFGVSCSKLTITKKPMLHSFIAARGFEAVNVHIIDRSVKDVWQLPKIPKKKTTLEDNKVSGDLFKSTM